MSQPLLQRPMFQPPPVTQPTLASSLVQPLIIDIEAPCTWPTRLASWRHKPPYYLSTSQLMERVMLPRGQSVLDQMIKDLRMQLNIYYAVVGFRLGAGKSDQNLRIAKYLDDYLRPGKWSVDSCYADNIPRIGELVEQNLDHFTIAWDEPQDKIRATNWAEIPDEIATFITAERENQICIGFATPDLQGVWFLVRRQLNYVFEIRVRDKFHTHGLLWERQGNPMKSDEFVITGSFTFPRATDPYLVEQLAYYHGTYKKRYTANARANFIQEVSHGGRSKGWGAEFVQWLQGQGLKGKAKKAYVTIFSGEKGLGLSTDQKEQVWAQYCLLYDSGQLPEAKKHARRKH